MKISKVILQGFRGYYRKTEIDFDDITVIVGKNDMGKSSILEAIDIFFDNRKIDVDDKCIYCEETELITIGIEFIEFPENLIIDEAVETNLKQEYLLNRNERLEIHKEYKIGSRISSKTYLIANHPKNEKLSDLLKMKITDLKLLADELEINPEYYDRRKSSEIREAIRTSFPEDIDLEEMPILIDEEGLKNIWEKLSYYLPVFALFQADRTNTDKDNEVQDPMKFATKEVLKTIQPQLDEIKKIVQEKVKEIAEQTLNKVKEMNEEIATSLLPEFQKEPNWAGLFSPVLKSEGIPLNKRGSGVRRLVLINFFRAEAERKKKEKNSPNVIYAIEEPETSQHPDWQIKLINALKELSASHNTQVVITTHSPKLAKLLPIDSIRFVKVHNNETQVFNGSNDVLEEVVSTLGVLSIYSEMTIDVLLCLEGPSDVEIINHYFKLLECNSDRERFAIIPLGGGTLEHWVDRKYLKKLNLPEIHIYDNDVDKYQDQIDTVNARGDNSWGTLTQNRAIENYLHPKFIKEIYGIENDFIDLTSNWQTDWKQMNVSREVSNFLKDLKENGHTHIRGESERVVKIKLGNEIHSRMTKDDLEDLGILEEIEFWIQKIRERIK
jgi:putative ATP-dependent endonuclease of OLD family